MVKKIKNKMVAAAIAELSCPLCYDERIIIPLKDFDHKLADKLVMPIAARPFITAAFAPETNRDFFVGTLMAAYYGERNFESII